VTAGALEAPAVQPTAWDEMVSALHELGVSIIEANTYLDRVKAPGLPAPWQHLACEDMAQDLRGELGAKLRVGVERQRLRGKVWDAERHLAKAVVAELRARVGLPVDGMLFGATLDQLRRLLLLAQEPAAAAKRRRAEEREQRRRRPKCRSCYGSGRGYSAHGRCMHCGGSGFAGGVGDR